MAVLLPLLAALQYYWLGQVSVGASERLQSSLRASATGFRHDFNREFIRAYLNFHMDSLAPADDIDQYHLERLEHWNQTAPYPRLISDVFVVNYDAAGRSHLRHLNKESRRFESTEWSGELSSLRDHFVGGDETRSARPLESFAEELPALVVPFPPATSQGAQSQSPQPVRVGVGAEGPSLPPGFTVIKIDANYLKLEFIPLLLERHLSSSWPTEYDVAIVSVNHPERSIYSSRYPKIDFGFSDVSTRVFGLEADELESFLKSEGASSRGAEQSANRPLRLIKLRLLRRPAVESTIAASELDGRWQLLIKHQAGSLAVAVGGARRRNLAISFGILLLLGAGILMTAISTRRAERLALQQINFVAGVSHELRTPLAVICSAGENLAHGIVVTPQKAEQYGQVIYKEGKRLTDMVEQVLEFAGAQSGRQRYDLRPTSVANFIEAAVAVCKSQTEERDFHIETTIAPELPLVMGDASALRRALQNLISNAIKYGGENGAQRWVRIGAEPGAKDVRITIEDRGLGIDSADIPHIFDPFYRGRQAIAAQIEGSGVGLSLVKQIVEAHGGRISVRSTPGVGSTFTFQLPIAAQAGK